MRSFLQNFLADDRGRFHKVLDLRQHALDTGITVTDATVQEVVNAMPDLRGLRLTGCTAITDAGVWTIARQCAVLDTIFLAGCERVTELSLRVLAHNCRLVTIDLSDCPQVDDSVLQTLAAGSWTLETFIIQRSRRITDAGIVKIAQCCKRLRHLDVSECEHVGEYGDKALVEIGRCCHELEVLDLFGCRHVHDVGIKAVARGCPRLTTLKLTGCHGVSSAALRVLAEQRPPLEILSLAGCVKTTNEDLDAIARNCPRIHWLDISGSPLIDATGVRALARFCDKLTFLSLAHCQRINDAALLELRSRTSLTQLSVAHCPRITELGVDALTAACTSLLTLDMTECGNIGRRFLQQLVQKLEFVEWATAFFGFQPLPNAAALVVARDRRLLEHRSAVKIQAAIRGCLARGGVWEAKLKYVQRKTLPKIQARIRGFLVRRQLAEQRQLAREKKAAVQLATAYRDWRLRRLLARHRRVLRIQRDQEAAALIFQKIFRGHRDRRRVRAMRDERHRQALFAARVQTMLELAAIKVQRAYRGHRGRADATLLRAAREANRRQQSRERYAAALIQRVYRGHQGRRRRAARLAELLHQKQCHDGAKAMQKVFRGHRARRNARILRLEAAELQRIQAAMTIQRYWRGIKDKHLAAVLIGLVKLRAREVEAARTIQNAYRLHASRGFMKAMRLARQLQQRRLRGAVTIQRVLRGHRGRAEAEVQRELAKLDVIARPLFQKEARFAALVQDLETRVATVEGDVKAGEADEAQLAAELEKTMQIKTKYHDSSRITGTPQRYLTQFLQIQLADQLRARRVALAMDRRTLETLLSQLSDAQKQLRAVRRELEPLTVGVVVQTRERRTKRLQTKVRRERVAATNIQRVFRGYRVRTAVSEGANCWIEASADGGAGVYYYNTFTGESRWRKPLAMTIFGDTFLQPLQVEAPATTANGSHAATTDGSARSQRTAWYEAFDDRVGQAYYYNAKTKEYQWDRPELVHSFLTDTRSARQRREWLENITEDGDVEAFVASSALRNQLGEWEHRVDPLSENAFYYHPPTAELRVSLSPRSVHQSLSPASSEVPVETSSSVAASASSRSRRSARSVKTETPRSLEWQYRYGYTYDSDGGLVPYDGDASARPVWTEHVDETSGLTYYYNHVTQEYRWERPPEFGLSFEEYAQTTNTSRAWLEAAKAQLADDSSTGELSARSSGRRLTARATRRRSLGQKWVEYIDPDSGHTFYCNEITGETRWSLSPRSARDKTDQPGEISIALYTQVKRLRDEPVAYSSRETHMAWLETAMDERDWRKVDALVQQILLREQSEVVAARQQPAGDWQTVTDTQGNTYYYNSRTGETTWNLDS
ncbi:hypothetical protein ATCC90586_007333 [Pythium insidiosum]|nr:hypothetical protein ATCC90586_007333 [Pythium insidiosum]